MHHRIVFNWRFEVVESRGRVGSGGWAMIEYIGGMGHGGQEYLSIWTSGAAKYSLEATNCHEMATGIVSRGSVMIPGVLGAENRDLSLIQAQKMRTYILPSASKMYSVLRITKPWAGIAEGLCLRQLKKLSWWSRPQNWSLWCVISWSKRANSEQIPRGILARGIFLSAELDLRSSDSFFNRLRYVPDR